MKLTTFKVEDAKVLFEKVPYDEAFDLTEMPTEEKTEFLRYCIQDIGMKNMNILANIILMAQGCDLSDELFAQSDIFFNDAEEYIDIKLSLKEEIEEFDKKIVTYYFAAVKSTSVLLNDHKFNVPNLYYHTLLAIDLNTISRMMNKVSIDYADIPLIFNADIILSNLSVKDASIASVLVDFLKEAEKKLGEM